MDFTFFVPILALLTMLAVIVFALYSKQQTEKRLHSDVPKSTLAEDAPNSRSKT